MIANGFLRATDDSDLLVPDGVETDEAILRSVVGSSALPVVRGTRRDLEELEAFHGELPTEPIPGLIPSGVAGPSALPSQIRHTRVLFGASRP